MLDKLDRLDNNKQQTTNNKQQTTEQTSEAN
jgi:hypothetical protein